jgi:TetR/AcrR family transcriptional repressor of lmrAB and yxaGH operons
MNPTTPPPRATRERLIEAMLDVLSRKGYHGVGLNELLTQAQAPKGVLYHHFPGGKAELAVAAIQAVVEHITQGLGQLTAGTNDPADALAAWMEGAQRRLAGSQYERGCPLATIALESTPDDVAIRQALADGFVAVRATLATTLARAGMEPTPARDMAALLVSAYEGALLQARVAGQPDTMQHTAQALLPLLRLRLQALARPGQTRKDAP